MNIEQGEGEMHVSCLVLSFFLLYLGDYLFTFFICYKSFYKNRKELIAPISPEPGFIPDLSEANRQSFLMNRKHLQVSLICAPDFCHRGNKVLYRFSGTALL